MGTTSPTEDHGNDRAARIARVVEDVMRRRAGGEQVDVADIVDQHPNLKPELAERLSTLGRIEPADRRAAETETAPDKFDTVGLEEPSKAEPRVPSHSFPGYEIVRRISEGGQGIVYQALQKTTKRKVAIKVLLQGLHASKTARKRFEREIELVAALKHPNIISIFHSGTTKEGLQFYVMDYVRGLSLKEYVREKKLTLEDTLKLFMKVCAAIQYAHQRGVMHRDLKPSNILVDSEGNPKVLDFGLAKLLAGPVETIVSISQEVIGTLPYMSPEQARGNPDEIDTRTDIYSLGVMLYELLTGSYPYPVVGRMADVLKHIAETEPTPPSRAWKSDAGVSRKSSGRFRPGQCPIDGEVQTIVMKSLSKDRDRRYQSAGDLARDIDNYLTGQPIEARRDSGWYVLRKALWRHRVPVAAALVMLLVGCVVLWGITEFRRANRNGWMAALRAVQLGGHSPDIEQADAGIWELVASGEATDAERELLASRSVRLYRSYPRRDLVSLATYNKTDEGYLFAIGYGGQVNPKEYGILLTITPRFDGSPVRTVIKKFFVQRGSLSKTIWTKELSVGPHVLSGVVSVEFARVTNTNRQQDEPVEYKTLDAAPVELPFGPWRFTVVERYPPDYPPMIVENSYAHRFTQDFRLDEVSLSVEEYPFSRTVSSFSDAGSRSIIGYDDDIPLDVLRVELSFPIPPFEIACKAVLRIPERHFQHTFFFVVGPPDPDGQFFNFFSHVSGLSGLGCDESRCTLLVQEDLLEVLGARPPSALVGAEVVLSVVPSRPAALRLSDAERFIGVSGTGRGRVQDVRDATRLAAENTVFASLGDSVVPTNIVGQLEANNNLSESVQAAALQMAKALIGDATHLNNASWGLVRLPGSGPEACRLALRLARESCRMEPDDVAYRNTLGVAQYRVGLFEDALATFTRSEILNGAIPGEVAFIAMAHHQLGHTDEARAALKRLRALMNDPKHANAEEPLGFLPEAEELIEGKKEPEKFVGQVDEPPQPSP